MMAQSLIQFAGEFAEFDEKSILSETSSALESLSDSEMSDSVQMSEKNEEVPRTSETTSCYKEATPSQRRKRSVMYKTPDYSTIKPKICFGKVRDAPKTRSGAKKEADLPSTAGGKELRKQIVTYKTPDFSKVKARVCFPKISDESRFGDERTKDLRKQPLHYRTPDYSQVKPKVHFPKNGYTPPKSRFAVKESDLHSSAVKEVTTCQEDDRLLLQEIYTKLVIQLSEAENTVDELRLKAKDQIVSAQTQSGFVSESCLSPPAPPSPLHQRAPESLSHRSDSLTSLTAIESNSYDTEERTSDVSSRIKERQTADKSTQADTRTSAPAPKPELNFYVNFQTAVPAAAEPHACTTPSVAACVEPCMPTHQFSSGGVSEPRPHMVPTSSEKGTSFRVRGQTKTSDSISDSLDQAIELVAKITNNCRHVLDSVRCCRQLLSR